VTPQLRDALVQAGAIVTAIIVGALISRLLEPRWEVALGVGLIFLANAIVKWRWPNHRVLSRISWLHFGVVFLMVEAVLVLLADWTIVGPYWTIPAVITLGLFYCVLHLFLTARRG